MRELTQNEIVAVAGGWECTVGYPHGVSCTFSDKDIRDWVCDTFGWWCSTQSTDRAVNDK